MTIEVFQFEMNEDIVNICLFKYFVLDCSGDPKKYIR